MKNRISILLVLIMFLTVLLPVGVVAKENDVNRKLIKSKEYISKEGYKTKVEEYLVGDSQVTVNSIGTKDTSQTKEIIVTTYPGDLEQKLYIKYVHSVVGAGQYNYYDVDTCKFWWERLSGARDIVDSGHFEAHAMATDESGSSFGPQDYTGSTVTPTWVTSTKTNETTDTTIRSWPALTDDWAGANEYYTVQVKGDIYIYGIGWTTVTTSHSFF